MCPRGDSKRNVNSYLLEPSTCAYNAWTIFEIPWVNINSVGGLHCGFVVGVMGTVNLKKCQDFCNTPPCLRGGRPFWIMKFTQRKAALSLQPEGS